MDDNNLKILYKSLQDGYDTLNMLSLQKEKLKESERKLSKTEYCVASSKRLLTNMKSFFGTIKNLFSRKPKKPPIVFIRKKSKIYPRIALMNDTDPINDMCEVLDELEEVANVLNNELNEQDELIGSIQDQSYTVNDDIKSLIKKEEELLK